MNLKLGKHSRSCMRAHGDIRVRDVLDTHGQT